MPVGRLHLLSRALRALDAQSFDQPWELVVVTSLSDEEVRPELESFSVPVEVVRPPGPLNASGSRNLGVCRASAPLLMFCDDDNEVGEHWLAAMAEALGSADAAAGAYDLERLNRPEVVAAYGYQSQEPRLSTTGGWLPFGGGGNLAVRRTVFDAVGGFDETFGASEDRDLCVRLQLAGCTLAFAPDALVHRRLRQTTKEVLVQAHRWASSEVQLYRRHRHHGMPPAGRAGGLWAWLRLARDTPHLLRRDRRVAWLRRLAERLGRLSGSVRLRTWYP